MTTSAPFRSASLCQRYSASCPNTSFAAWSASSSQLLPGKTTTPNRMSVDLDAITFDDGIGEHLVGNLRRQRARLRRLGGREIELEVLALPHVLDVAVAERMQRVGNRFALRSEDGRLQRDENPRSHAIGPRQQRSMQSPLSPQGVSFVCSLCVFCVLRVQRRTKNATENMGNLLQLIVEIEGALDL